MKQTLKSLFAMLLVMVMLFTVAGCENDKVTTSEPAGTQDGGEEVNNDDFFTDTTEDVATEDGGNADGTGNAGGTGNSGKPSGASGNKAPTENKIGGKTWEEVKASIPKNLKGTTVNMYNWNPASEYTGAPTVIEQFEKETGIKVKWNTINYEVYVTRLAALVASGDAPDTVRCRLPVPDRLQSFQPLSTANYDFTDAAWDQVLMKDYTVGGVCYATSLKNTHLGSVD